MTNFLQTNIPVGYTVEQKNQVMDIDLAVFILKSKKRRKYISAYRKGYEFLAEMRVDVWKCPYCNHEQAATTMEGKRNRSDKFLYGNSYANNATIEEWGTREISFLEKRFEKIQLNNVPVITGEQICPKCYRKSSPSTGRRTVSITQENQKIIVKSEVCGLEEMISIPWKFEKASVIEFPLYEIITFNVKSGRTYVEIESSNGICVSKRDITTGNPFFNKGLICKLIEENIILSRTLKRIFTRVFAGKLPFEKEELCLEKYILMTRFIGFSRGFYDAIPFNLGTRRLEKNFEQIAQHLHTTKKAMAFYYGSKLPKNKSVKRLFFSEPGLLFYTNECEKLWEIIKDINYFCVLLNSEFIYSFLALIHERPRIFEFIEDYFRVKGGRAFVTFVTNRWLYFVGYAMDYCMMNEMMKLNEQKRWTAHRFARKNYVDIDEDFDEFRYYRNMVVSFSIPMQKPYALICNCKIDGFSFVWLRCGNDYYSAGEDLKNCLKTWKVFYNPVIAIKKEGKIVASVEVGEQGVYQIYGKENTEISCVDGLEDAYRKWQIKFNVKSAYSYDEDSFPFD